MSDAARSAILVIGPVMENVVERQLAPRFDLVPIEQLDDARAPSIRAIATRGKLRVDDALLARLPNVEIVSNFGVGYDTIDAAAAAARGVVVTNTPDVLNEEVADLTIGLLLATVRELPQADRFVRAGGWKSGIFPLGPTLRERTVGLIGMGRIGQAIAKRLDAFSVPVVYHSRRAQPGVPYQHYGDLIAMARAVDVIIVIVPGGPATQHMVNAAVLEALGPDGILINVARGTVVDEEALLKALQDRTILSAGLDVFQNEPYVPEGFLALDNVVLLPHVGSATHHTRGAMGQLVVDNLVSWFEGRGPVTPVAETPWPRG
ncbi:2-hydroxyacid dehydrogenase [Xanthobacter tagetidis]|jgi:lactate dehydrogenase-like 2-hydroxyacid dehydrogenase|uniref:2-hydroxyacid dehydrogenase n=1 Tax=Xanthobacter tagetidis TaxID=60216 RepID=A0A3L6ZU86_9HYPH|nr:2-hydroxyacid dehydrogenase [Xanthobacter tagetidis]MBB6310321.1 lactate dehydrogenase-like 2-hydroxyacid dehydrogenase [Xanthobacter tagetidis]RLP71553.1 2-hydroxyacid dehydrogenase [Xanthobacter tagetidis]